ncbi:YfcC family protein [Psychrobacillus sp. NEAU-3TGS]|uniref:Na+/H+ antiporter NhaC family protein n=1 Tax=Psychrobacillus sp. NEAU-3TGS TaxID=2995412 RepID=UPI002495C371|nr:Na+/H+ antiporter NhaC family protein [Psychrobacillus sp. NEAU-3TGS]MDI2585596.1 YfcC family protein [Psychrobacillus sp. NEAU-3TGS]
MNAVEIREEKAKKSYLRKLQFKLPNVLVMMLLIMMFACLLTYIIPAGGFEYTEDKKLIAGSYHAVEQTPVNPILAITLILEGGIAASPVAILLLFIGGFLGGIFMLDSVNNVISMLINKFEKAGSNILVLGLFLLMSFIGFFIGGDMMIVFVTLGVILTRKLRLDPISALAVTFLPLFLAFSIAPSGEAQIAQLFAGIPLYSGYLERTIMFIFFVIVTAVYVVFYTNRVKNNPLKSAMSDTKWLTELDEDQNVSIEKNGKVEWKDFLVVAIIIIAPIILAYGNTVLGWPAKYGNGAVITVFGIAFVTCFLLKRKKTEDMILAFSKGVQDITIVAIVIVLARTVSIILEKGNILGTIVNGLTGSLNDFSSGMTAIIIFIVATIFNFLVPSGSGMSGVMMPILQPVAGMLGMTDQVLVTAIQFGGGLGNLIIPTLGATMGAIALAKANFGSWIKFMIPLFALWIVLGSIILYFIASIGWVGY